MSNKSNSHTGFLYYLPFLLFGFLFFLDYSLRKGGFLADDNFFFFPTKWDSIFEPNVYSRPYNGITKALISQFYFNRILLFGVFSGLVLLQFYLFYVLLKRLVRNKDFALIAAFFSFVFIFSTSTLFSPTMIVSAFPVLLGSYACILITRNTVSDFVVAGLLLFVSTLCYELLIFLLPAIALIKVDFTDRKNLLQRIIFILVLPAFLMFLYKNVVAKFIFADYSTYTANKLKFDFSNISDTAISMVKTYFLDVFFILKRGIINMQFFHWFDWVLAAVALVCSVIIFKKLKNIKLENTKRLIFFSLLFFLLSHVMFMFSIYKVNAYGFENRTLGVVRFTYSFFVFILFLYILSKMRNSLTRSAFSLIFSLFVFAGSITLISQKNAWLFASSFNEKLVAAMDKALPQKKGKMYVFVSYDKSRYKQFVSDEPTLKSPFEFSRIIAKFAPKRSIRADIFIPKNYHLDQLSKYPLNNRYATVLSFDVKGNLIHKEFSLPFYFFDYDKNNVTYIQNRNEWEAFINNKNTK